MPHFLFDFKLGLRFFEAEYPVLKPNRKNLILLETPNLIAPKLASGHPIFSR
jgi:hypothetical protein